MFLLWHFISSSQPMYLWRICTKKRVKWLRCLGYHFQRLQKTLEKSNFAHEFCCRCPWSHGHVAYVRCVQQNDQSVSAHNGYIRPLRISCIISSHGMTPSSFARCPYDPSKELQLQLNHKSHAREILCFWWNKDVSAFTNLLVHKRIAMISVRIDLHKLWATTNDQTYAQFKNKRKLTQKHPHDNDNEQIK